MSGPRNLLATLPYQKLFFDTSSTNITTSAWVPILSKALNVKACTAIHYFYTGTGILKLSNGDTGSETANELMLHIFPGGVGSLIPFELAHGKLLSARAVDADVTSGILVINFFG